MRVWLEISAASNAGRNERKCARNSIAASDGNVPPCSGAKPAESGWNGAVSVTCNPIAPRVAAAASSASASL
jgi:hypothetical protein